MFDLLVIHSFVFHRLPLLPRCCCPHYNCGCWNPLWFCFWKGLQEDCLLNRNGSILKIPCLFTVLFTIYAHRITITLLALVEMSRVWTSKINNSLCLRRITPSMWVPLRLSIKTRLRDRYFLSDGFFITPPKDNTFTWLVHYQHKIWWYLSIKCVWNVLYHENISKFSER